jgi:tripartite-type tricarboxylate transporter receptor subunit TctC
LTPDSGGKKLNRHLLAQRFVLRALAAGRTVDVMIVRFAPWAKSVALGLVVAVGPALSTHAQDYPTQPIKLVVPFVAGGGVDVVARIIAPRLGEAMGRSIIIENKGGAGGMLGALTVAQSPADGYTLLFGTGSTHGTNSSVYSKLSYDPVKDFAPVVLVSTSPLLLVVSPAVPAKTAQEFIALARGQPGQLSFGSYGTGSINHLSIELFNSMTGIQANHIPYRGAAPALTDLIAGRIQYTFDGVSTSLGYIQSGTIRLLAQTGRTRSPILSDYPTIAESAVPGYDTSVWFALFAPAGTPKPIVDLINSRMNAVLALPQIRESFAKLGIEPQGGGPDVVAGRVQREMQKWSTIVRDKNIRIEQ